jgi:hypothetical protein
MKNLIEKSVKFKGIGSPETFTEFNLENEYSTKNPKFKSLTRLSGRTITILFDVQENDEVVSMSTRMEIIRSSDVTVIKNNITDHINSIINN